jgi:type II secretory pathway pseudopilin PulG
MKIKYHCNRFCSGLQRRLKPFSAGFTLVEVLIAGCILLMVMVGISRISVQSITSGRNRMERDRIEAAIHNNIQLIQQADAKLTLESMPGHERRDACLDPAQYLKDKLDAQSGSISVPKPVVKGIDGTNPITRTIEIGKYPGITVVTYSFLAPEYSIGHERRVVELNPNFQNRCILE